MGKNTKYTRPSIYVLHNTCTHFIFFSNSLLVCKEKTHEGVLYIIVNL